MLQGVYGVLVSFILAGLLAYRPVIDKTVNPFATTLRFSTYTFQVTTEPGHPGSDLTIKAWRGALLLTTFPLRTDGPVVRAEVADLDNNRFPEVYVYTSSSGTGSFGNIYGWQFFADRKAEIKPVNWQKPIAEGYMGHDSLWIEPPILCRRFPVYRPGDANVSPSGGWQMIRYQLRATGQQFQLVTLP